MSIRVLMPLQTQKVRYLKIDHECWCSFWMYHHQMNLHTVLWHGSQNTVTILSRQKFYYKINFQTCDTNILNDHEKHYHKTAFS